MLVVLWKLVLILYEEQRSPGLKATVYHCHFLYAYIIETRCITNRKIIVFLSRLHLGSQFLDLLQKNQACGKLSGLPTLKHCRFFNGCYVLSCSVGNEILWTNKSEDLSPYSLIFIPFRHLLKFTARHKYPPQWDDDVSLVRECIIPSLIITTPCIGSTMSRILTTKDRGRSQFGPCEMCGGKSGNWTGVPPITSIPRPPPRQ